MMPDPFFVDRNDAGLKLFELLKNKINQHTILYAIPRGGVAVAKPISAHFKLPIHLLMIKKISHPDNSELAIGACGLTDYILGEENALTDEQLQSTLRSLREKLIAKQAYLSASDPLTDLSGRTAIIIDDGAATGLTLLCGIHEIKKLHPDKTVLAIPVASEDAADLLKQEVDELICPAIKKQLHSVGEYYEDFKQVSDDEVKEMIWNKDDVKK